ncbi:MAG: trypsin-like peptidase domain-containing protein [Burkholderiaceae bacterium]|nr:trypsin-like peptidase domain-containing protein [Rhodoferax sp.]MCP5284939.1 trypsin-like peptidase domain-containing protein [Burkholderiaceae bacterium]
MQRRTLLLAGAAAAALATWATVARADVPGVIVAARPSVLPIGRFDALASPRFGFRGTAFVVGDGRHLVSNHHVVGDAGDALAQWVVQRPLPDGGQEWRRVEVVSRDREHDLVLLRLQDGDPLPPLAVADDAVLREGLAVLLMGFPIGGILGFQPVTHRGMVSSIAPIALPAANARQLRDQALATLRRGSFDIAQLDATAYPGNSGGPVLDAATGQVVAVVNMVLVRGSREAALSAPSGISYAIPGRWVRALVDGAR